jgi:protein TonB
VFDNVIERGPPGPIRRFIAFSVALHAIAIGLLLHEHARVEHRRELAVVFRAISNPPAPPPPPAGGPVRAVQHKPVVGKRIEPKRVVIKAPDPKPIPKPEPKPEPQVVESPATPATPSAPVASSGPAVAGGQAGGAAGGVAGGTVGGKVGAPLKPKNVAAFVIQRDVLQQVPPRLSEVFKQAHRGQGTVVGMYKVCVGADGHVFDVVAVKSVPGADADIIDGIKGGWLYKPQQVPVCFLYNMPITIEG